MATSAGEAKLAAFLRGERVTDLGKAMGSLPGTVNVELVVGFVEKHLDRLRLVAKCCAKLPPRAIRAVLAAIPAWPAHAELVMWRVAVPSDLGDAALAKAWQRALAASLDLDTSYAWGSKQRRAKIAGLVADRAMLPAIQAAVAHGTKPSLTMLAVLAAEGSAASYDALVAHIAEAFTSADHRIDLLGDLRVHAARTPALDALFAEIDGALATRNATSPALALGPAIGIGEVATLWFHVWVGSTRRNRNSVPLIQCSFDVDSRSKSWFHASVNDVGPTSDGSKGTHFGANPDGFANDDLGVGHCEAAALPRWLATTAKKLAITWNDFEPRTNLRGSKKALLVRWLRSELP